MSNEVGKHLSMGRALSKPKILVIDHDGALRTVVRLTLEDAGYEVVEAGDGREGERTFDEVSPDLIVTDIAMPEQKGVETIITIRHDYPEAKIVAMSGTDHDAHYLHYATKLGADATLTKPVHRDALLDTVKVLLR
jgi:two-component system chemotaxis response regulator CheY